VLPSARKGFAQGAVSELVLTQNTTQRSLTALKFLARFGIEATKALSRAKNAYFLSLVRCYSPLLTTIFHHLEVEVGWKWLPLHPITESIVIHERVRTRTARFETRFLELCRRSSGHPKQSIRRSTVWLR
jgi:hypothetical protein